MMNIQFIMNNITRFNSNVNVFLSGTPKYKAWVSEIYCFCRHGCSPDDYFRYEFYKKSDYERNAFITYRRSQQLIKQYNDPAYIKYFANKRNFNKKFNSYIHRDWIDIKNVSFDEFNRFVQRNGEVILKPVKGGQGKGIFKLSYADIHSFEIRDYKEFIAEQIIKQHSAMESLNPTSVNTVRILTFKGKAIACALRIGGSGAVVDNLHSNGVCAHLDRKTGIIDSMCINNKLEKFLFHPDTKIELVGFQVPNWDKVIATAESAAKVIPQVQYIGWDIAVTKNGTALIEGNHDPGHDVVQMIAQTGLYKEIKKIELSK